jgi:AraC-like DNA-binding protein
VDGPGAPLDLLHARIRQPFARHGHAQYAVGVCTEGVERIYYRRETVWAGPGTVVVLEPGEVHTGGPERAGGFRYRVMYPEPALFGERGRPRFERGVINDPGLAARLRAVHRALSEGTADPLAAESALLGLGHQLVARHAVRPVGGHPERGAGATRPVDGIAGRVMARLGDEPVDPPSLAEMSAELGLSRYQLLRGFTAEVGMPPYAWLAQHRVGLARRLLERGRRPGEVAVAVGFADQAHLTRWFRRVVGVTPAVYRNGVQDIGAGAAAF